MWKTRWPLIAAIVLVLLAGLGVRLYLSKATNLAGPPSNAIMIIAPYPL
jgi:hypothetical protein